MTTNSLQHGTSNLRGQDHQVLSTIVFIPCFFMMLAAGAVLRLLPPALQSRSMRFARRGSLFHAARTAANDCVAFALMG